MSELSQLFANNRRWAEQTRQEDPDFFTKLSAQQTPEHFWIGCSDSRVPANELLGLLPGEVFVHRNVANVVVHSDLNCLSALQFAVDILKVKHVIVCGHYGCGGVHAALHDRRMGLVDNWIRHVQDVLKKHETALTGSDDNRWHSLCVLNVIEQVMNLTQTTVVQDAWQRGQTLTIHGWVYGLKDGLLKDTGLCVNGMEGLAASYQQALAMADGLHSR